VPFDLKPTLLLRVFATSPVPSMTDAALHERSEHKLWVLKLDSEKKFPKLRIGLCDCRYKMSVWGRGAGCERSENHNTTSATSATRTRDEDTVSRKGEKQLHAKVQRQRWRKGNS